MLGDPLAQEPVWRFVAVCLTFAAVGLWALLLPIASALRERQETSRWASNLRDVANFVAWTVFLGAFLVAGVPLWAAVLAAGSVVVVLELARHLRQSSRRRQRLAIVLGLALALPVAVFPSQVTRGLDALVVGLFGG